ncbi:sugar phosphate isomerase/epimerase family protein [Paenibacillus rigui]|uniref:Xylose isomerase-like TIM barrel domain-containing protein n=1 Tax=Paenibacillus rigui TaxID=554312 RepID=A0A229UHZ2_9BACL|nr:sugar phosphate isomerase/epimerase [Paenibacillus rigui]OXM82993.1 hypothetical protein CF651_27635 [Paenibacillus rigui]
MTKHNILIGHTAITWDNKEVEHAIAAIGSCGYWGTETFGWVLEEWERSNRDLLEVFRRSELQLTSLYCHLDIVDPNKRVDSIQQVMDWIKLYKKFNGPVVVVGGMMLQRDNFSITEHLSNISTTLNELAKRIVDQGLICCFHPHTGTPVETKDEIHRVINAMDSSVVKFAPDLGQIAKGGSDPSEFVKEYYELIRMVHIKDYIGGPVEKDAEGREIDKTGFLGYTPLGMGSVDIQSILEYLEERDYNHYALVELDGNQWSATRKGNPLMPSLEAVQTSKRYLEKLGYRNFRTE